MRIFASAVAATLLSTLAAVWTPGRAGPDLSWSSNDIDIAQDVCMARGQNAFTQGGWANIHLSGQPALATVAHKEPLVAVILCLSRAIGGDHAIALVFVAGGDGDQGSNERNWLQSYMVR